MLAEPTVDVVIIATPPVTHGIMALAAAEAGKHVFCEKPLATSPPEAVPAAIEAADQRNIKLTVDYVMRWNPCTGSSDNLLQALRRSTIGWCSATSPAVRPGEPRG